MIQNSGRIVGNTETAPLFLEESPSPFLYFA